MPEVTCPRCGAIFPVTLSRHATGPAGDEPVAEAAPPGQAEGRETFSGQETVGGLVEELRDKQQ